MATTKATAKPTAKVKAKVEEAKAVEVKAEQMKLDVVEEPKKAAEKTTKKAATKKATTAKKETAKKATTKKEAVKASVNIQFAGKSYGTDDLVKIAKDVWKYDLKNKVSDFKSVDLYVKPEESMVYYVINGDIAGSFEI